MRGTNRKMWEFENLVLLALLSTLLILISIVWTRNRTLLSSVHSNPDLFKLSAGAAFVNIRQGVEVSVAKIQADADRAADRLPEEGEGAAQPDRFTYNNDTNNKIAAASGGAVGSDGEFISDSTSSAARSSSHDEENLPPIRNQSNSVDINEHEDDALPESESLSPIANLTMSENTAIPSSSSAIRKRAPRL